jgi:predicted metal-dependent HD superfamily phosphohydrolase
VELNEEWPLPGAERLRDELVRAYGGPGRGYHDLRHLAEVLARLRELEEAGVPFDGPVVRLAAWFHDAVYDGSPDDEERSARWAEQALVGRPEAGEVARLVRLTVHHRPADGDRNGCALSDADLAILAAPESRYAAYVADVRREYAAVSDADFRRGRAGILRELAGKPTLFHSAHARHHWEPVARANLERELAELEGT